MPTPGSTVVRRQLGVRLRRLRDAAGKTDRDSEEARLASRAKLWRIETGKVPVKVADVRALYWALYPEGTEKDADRLVRLRIERQQALDRPAHPLRLTAVLATWSGPRSLPSIAGSTT